MQVYPKLKSFWSRPFVLVDTCYFGDKSDIFILDNAPKLCNDFLNEPRLCYQFDGWCCETCETIKEQKSNGQLFIITYYI